MSGLRYRCLEGAVVNVSGSRVPTPRLFQPSAPFMAAANPSAGMLGWSGPVRTVRRSAVYLTERHMGPGTSRQTLTGMMPAFGTVPTVGLMMYRDCRLAGEIRHPSVSVPIAMGANPAATDIPDPDDEPLGLCTVIKLVSEALHE